MTIQARGQRKFPGPARPASGGVFALGRRCGGSFLGPPPVPETLPFRPRPNARGLPRPSAWPRAPVREGSFRPRAPAAVPQRVREVFDPAQEGSFCARPKGSFAPPRPVPRARRKFLRPATSPPVPPRGSLCPATFAPCPRARRKFVRPQPPRRPNPARPRTPACSFIAVKFSAKTLSLISQTLFKPCLARRQVTNAGRKHNYVTSFSTLNLLHQLCNHP